MWKVVSVEKPDTTALLALADVLQENGDLDIASTLDWCVQQKRWPAYREHSYRSTKKCWFWHPGRTGDTPKSFGNGLPRPIHEYVKHRNDSIKEAIANLSIGLVTIREMLPKWR
jgi:hypothetical protein